MKENFQKYHVMSEIPHFICFVNFARLALLVYEQCSSVHPHVRDMNDFVHTHSHALASLSFNSCLVILIRLTMRTLKGKN